MPTVGKVVSFIPGVGKFLGPGLSAAGGLLGELNKWYLNFQKKIFFLFYKKSM